MDTFIKHKLQMLFSLSFFVILGCQAQTTKGKEKEKKTSTVEDSASPTSLALPDGTGVIIPGGTLEVGTSVKLREAAAPSEFNSLADAGISSASLAIEVGLTNASGDAIDSVETPVLINIPVQNLALTLGTNLLGISSELCAVLKARDNSLLLWRNSLLTYDETTKKVKFLTKKFGKFQLMFCGDKTVAGFEEVGDSELSSVSSWEDQNQIDSSTGTAVTSDLSYTFTLVKSYLGSNAKVCLMLVRTSSNPLIPSTSSHDNGGDVDIIMGATEVTLSEATIASKLSFSSKNLVTGGGAYLAIFTQDTTDTCSIKAGSKVETTIDNGSFKFNELYAFFVSSETLKKESSGTLGATGFGMHKLTIISGINSLPNDLKSAFSAYATLGYTSTLTAMGFTEKTACLSLGDGNKSSQGGAAIFEKTISLGADLIDGEEYLEIYAPSAIDSVTTTDISIEVGAECMKNESSTNNYSDVSADAAKYRLRIPEVGPDATAYLMPAQLKVTSTVLSTTSDICLGLYRSDSFSTSGPASGFDYERYDEAYKIKLGTSYNVYTLLDPAYSSSRPYDAVLFSACGFNSADAESFYNDRAYDFVFDWAL